MLTFVIPVLNEAGALPTVLAGVRDGFPDSEVVVVDGGSRDGSVASALPLASVVLIAERGRARQMNLGAAVARGDWVVFLHADTRPEFAALDLDAELDAAAAGGRSWGFCRIRLVGQSRSLRLIAWAMNQRSRLTSVATGDQMLFVRRDLFDDLGGFADIPLMEDVELAKRLRRLSKPQASRLRVCSSGRRWDEQGVVLTVLRMWALRLAYWLGVSPQRLWSFYYGRAALGASAPSPS